MHIQSLASLLDAPAFFHVMYGCDDIIPTNYSFTCLKVNTNWIRTIVDNKYTELVGIDLYLLTYLFLTKNKKKSPMISIFCCSAIGIN